MKELLSLMAEVKGTVRLGLVILKQRLIFANNVIKVVK